MTRRRTEQEEQTRQLKIISAQMAPMGVFFRVGFYLWLVLTGLGGLTMLLRLAAGLPAFGK